jgi:hypothetical protein
MSEEGAGTLNREHLDRLVRHLNEEVEPGRAVLYADVEAIHLNGSESLYGEAYASLLDTGMGALPGLPSGLAGGDDTDERALPGPGPRGTHLLPK